MNLEKEIKANDYPFLQGGGEMGALTRAYNWTRTSIGTPDSWPQSLCTAVAMILSSRFPMFLWWGDDLIQFYNDAYRPSLGNEGKHPMALGQKGAECWPEIWPDIYPLIQQVLTTGEATWNEDQLLPIYRNGRIEDVYWTYSYSPVRSNADKISGVLVICQETTRSVQQLQSLQESNARLQHDSSDFKTAFEKTTGINILVAADAPHYTILAVTDGLIDAQPDGKKKEDIVGKPFFEPFPPNPDDRNFTGESNLRSSFEYVITNKEAHRLPVQHYDLPNGDGTYSERYWAINNKPVLDGQGEVVYIIHTGEDITNAIKAQHLEEQSKVLERAHNLFEQAPFAIHIFKGPDLIIEMASERSLAMWGKDRDVIGKPLLTVFPGLAESDVIALARGVMDTGKPYEAYESPSRIKAYGSEAHTYFNFVYQPYYEGDNKKPVGVLVFASDVTERVNAKKEVLESEERFRTMAEGTELLIAVGDETSNATYFNKAWVELTGRPMEQLLKFGWADLIHPEDRERYINIYLDAFAERKPFTGEFRVLNKDGEYRRLLAKGPPRFRADGSFAGYISSCIDITERWQVEEALKESEQRVRSLVESAPFPIGVYVGREMRISLANQAIINVFGKGSDVIGKRYKEVLPELEGQEIFTQIERVYTTGIPFHAKNQRVDIVADGRIRPYYFNYSFTPLYDTAGKVYGVMNTAADVTDLNLAMQKVAENEQSFRNTILKAPVAICIFKGPKHIVEVANDRMIVLWGTTKENVQGKPIFEGLPEARDQGFEQILDQVFITGEAFAAQDVAVELPRNGKVETVYVNFVFSPNREAGGAIEGILAVAVDVTAQVVARRKIEEVVTDRTRELAAVNDNLQRSNAELEQFAYIASHDLQEPLRKVTTFAQMLELSLGEVNEDARNYLNRINNSTIRMTALIRDVLNYSQLSKDAEPYKPVDLQHIIDELKTDFELLIEQKGATIHCTDLPVVAAVRLQMTQLFGNLISNALKFSRPEVPLLITIKTTKLAKEEIAHHSLPDIGTAYYNIELRDNGIGFKPEYAAQIFHIFQRLHGKTEYAGTGIGLAMCRKIAQNHHGDIYAYNSTEQGAVFNVILPEKQPDTTRNLSDQPPVP